MTNIKSILTLVIVGLLCFACSREQDEVYQDPYADPDVNVGQNAIEHVEPADRHEGRYSIHSYEFRGKGPAHKMTDVKKYELDHEGSRGSKVSVNVHIEWPEEKAGLSKDALAKVRKAILWMAFTSEVVWTVWKDDKTPVVYIAPEALGETEETLKKRSKELWAEEGEVREFDEFGLQPADWWRLIGDALSRQTRRLPAKDDGRVTTKALELAISGIKACAQDSYKCDPPRMLNGHWWHCCSQWTFCADLHLDWPFGIAAKENAEWYERPVLCVWNEGYDNDDGHGVHSSYCAKVYSLPDGRELSIEDYFAQEKLNALSDVIWKRFAAENMDPDKAKLWEDVAQKENAKWIIDPANPDMQIKKEGVKWTWKPDSLGNVPSIFVKWEDLAPFRK